jgi:hypothetical protein
MIRVVTILIEHFGQGRMDRVKGHRAFLHSKRDATAFEGGVDHAINRTAHHCRTWPTTDARITTSCRT